MHVIWGRGHMPAVDSTFETLEFILLIHGIRAHLSRVHVGLGVYACALQGSARIRDVLAEFISILAVKALPHLVVLGPRLGVFGDFEKGRTIVPYHLLHDAADLLVLQESGAVFHIEVLRNDAQQLTCLSRPEPRHELQKKISTVC